MLGHERPFLRRPGRAVDEEERRNSDAAVWAENTPCFGDQRDVPALSAAADIGRAPGAPRRRCANGCAPTTSTQHKALGREWTAISVVVAWLGTLPS